MTGAAAVVAVAAASSLSSSVFVSIRRHVKMAATVVAVVAVCVCARGRERRTDSDVIAAVAATTAKLSLNSSPPNGITFGEKKNDIGLIYVLPISVREKSRTISEFTTVESVAYWNADMGNDALEFVDDRDAVTAPQDIQSHS